MPVGQTSAVTGRAELTRRAQAHGVAVSYQNWRGQHVEVLPGAPEMCNGVDDNCDGITDNTPTGVGVVCGADGWSRPPLAGPDGAGGAGGDGRHEGAVAVLCVDHPHVQAILPQIQRRHVTPIHLLRQTLSQLQAMSPAALAHAKKSIYAWDAIHFDKGLARAEKIYFEDLMKTSDAREGIRAFLEKRVPKWRGE